MSNTQPSLESSVTIFLDRTHHSKHTERLLRLLGVPVEVHRRHFVHDTPDHEWIPVCAAKGWVILTGDKGIENDGLNRATVIQCAAKVFMMNDYKSKGIEQTAAIIAARRKIARTAENNVGPFYCPVEMLGDSHVGTPKFYSGGYALKITAVPESLIPVSGEEKPPKPKKAAKAERIGSPTLQFGPATG